MQLRQKWRTVIITIVLHLRFLESVIIWLSLFSKTTNVYKKKAKDFFYSSWTLEKAASLRCKLKEQNFSENSKPLLIKCNKKSWKSTQSSL